MYFQKPVQDDEDEDEDDEPTQAFEDPDAAVPALPGEVNVFIIILFTFCQMYLICSGYDYFKEMNTYFFPSLGKHPTL